MDAVATHSLEDWHEAALNSLPGIKDFSSQITSGSHILFDEDQTKSDK